MVANALFTNRAPDQVGYVQAASAGITTALIVVPGTVLFVAMFRKVSRYSSITANRSGIRKREAVMRKKPVPHRSTASTLARKAGKGTAGRAPRPRELSIPPVPRVQSPDTIKVDIKTLVRGTAQRDVLSNPGDAFESIWGVKKKYNASQRPNYAAIAERYKADFQQQEGGRRMWGKLRVAVNAHSRKDDNSPAFSSKFFQVLRAAQRRSQMTIVSSSGQSRRLPHRMLFLAWAIVAAYFGACLYVDVLFAIKFEGKMIEHWLRTSFVSAAVDLLVLDPVKILILAWIPFWMKSRLKNNKFAV
jgi:hypothetical protein